MPHEPADPRAAYIHVPFCAHRCGYCDFTLVAGRDDLIEAYLRAIEIELRTLGAPREVDTLFFGGGTPTHLPAPQLTRLLGLVREWFPLARGYEFSVEANPAGLDDEKIAALAAAGVNRVSLGVQSFDAGMLSLLERDHRRESVHDACERLRSRFSNLSLDLIFGVPGQTLELWERTLTEAIELRPQHVSTYGLTFEKGTGFWARREKGLLAAAAEELERSMYAAAMDHLAAAGYEQYEISNFALPGFRCRHNEAYWTLQPYFGFGPGAARYVNGRREISHRSVTTWLKRVCAGQSPIAESEQLAPEERAREALVIGLRRCEGIGREEFQRRTGFTVDELAGKTLSHFVESGHLEDAGSYIRLTREGRFVADAVIVRLL